MIYGRLVGPKHDKIRIGLAQRHFEYSNAPPLRTVSPRAVPFTLYSTIVTLILCSTPRKLCNPTISHLFHSHPNRFANYQILHVTSVSYEELLYQIWSGENKEC